MKSFEIVIESDNKPKEIKTMFDLYLVCRHSYENWLIKSIPDTTDIFALKKRIRSTENS